VKFKKCRSCFQRLFFYFTSNRTWNRKVLQEL